MKMPIVRNSCISCGKHIEDYEDYVTYGWVRDEGEFTEVVEMYSHVECFKEDVKKSEGLEGTVDFPEVTYNFIRWVGKTWSYERRYKELKGEDMKKFLDRIPRDEVKEFGGRGWRSS